MERRREEILAALVSGKSDRIKDVSRTYEGLGELEHLESMAEELDETAENHSGTRRKPVLEAKEDAEYCLDE